MILPVTCRWTESSSIPRRGVHITGQAFTLGDENTADFRRGQIDNQDDSLQTIANNFTVSRGCHEIKTNAGGGGLTLSGTISRNTGSGVQFVALGGPIKTTLLLNTNGLIGGWATIRNALPARQRIGLSPRSTARKRRGVSRLLGGHGCRWLRRHSRSTLPATSVASNIRWRGGPSAAENLTLAAGSPIVNTFLFEGAETNAAKSRCLGARQHSRFANGGGISDHIRRKCQARRNMTAGKQRRVSEFVEKFIGESSSVVGMAKRIISQFTSTGRDHGQSQWGESASCRTAQAASCTKTPSTPSPAA